MVASVTGTYKAQCSNKEVGKCAGGSQRRADHEKKSWGGKENSRKRKEHI